MPDTSARKHKPIKKLPQKRAAKKRKVAPPKKRKVAAPKKRKAPPRKRPKKFKPKLPSLHRYKRTTRVGEIEYQEAKLDFIDKGLIEDIIKKVRRNTKRFFAVFVKLEYITRGHRNFAGTELLDPSNVDQFIDKANKLIKAILSSPNLVDPSFQFIAAYIVFRYQRRKRGGK